MAFYTGLIQLPSPCSGKNISGKKSRETGKSCYESLLWASCPPSQKTSCKMVVKKKGGVILLRVQFLPSCLDFLFRVSWAQSWVCVCVCWFFFVVFIPFLLYNFTAAFPPPRRPGPGPPGTRFPKLNYCNNQMMDFEYFFSPAPCWRRRRRRRRLRRCCSLWCRGGRGGTGRGTGRWRWRCKAVERYLKKLLLLLFGKDGLETWDNFNSNLSCEMKVLKKRCVWKLAE